MLESLSVGFFAEVISLYLDSFRMSVLIAGFNVLIFAQILGSSLLPPSLAWGGRHVSEEGHGSAEIIIFSGRVVYAKWDRVAGCNLDPKRSDCSLVEQSVARLHPCVLVWTVPFEDSSIHAPANRIVLRHEFCGLEVNE